jgi:hypothetical protein
LTSFNVKSKIGELILWQKQVKQQKFRKVRYQWMIQLSMNSVRDFSTRPTICTKKSSLKRTIGWLRKCYQRISPLLITDKSWTFIGIQVIISCWRMEFLMKNIWIQPIIAFVKTSPIPFVRRDYRKVRWGKIVRIQRNWKRGETIEESVVASYNSSQNIFFKLSNWKCSNISHSCAQSTERKISDVWLSDVRYGTGSACLAWEMWKVFKLHPKLCSVIAMSERIDRTKCKLLHTYVFYILQLLHIHLVYTLHVNLMYSQRKCAHQTFNLNEHFFMASMLLCL